MGLVIMLHLVLCVCHSQPSKQELVVDEKDPEPARVFLYSNLPIACQGIENYNPHTCWITFDITSTEGIAMRQRVSGAMTMPKNTCTCRIYEKDWKPDEGRAYNSEMPLDIVATVGVSM